MKCCAVFGGLRTTQAQTSLRICAVWSAPLFFAILESIDTGEISINKLVLVAEETGLKLTLSETLEACFVASWLG